jgi:glutathione synthase/RimK-type ligase-like ATP-grasp enzyme
MTSVSSRGSEGPAGRRPVVVVVYGNGSQSPMAISQAAASLCDLAWVVDSSEPHATWNARLLRKLGTVVDRSGISDDETVELLRPLHPDGIVAYFDGHITTASALAGGLGLEFPDAVVAQRLTDKSMQRAAFRDAGLPVPSCALVPSSPTPGEVDAIVDLVNFPVVIKPRYGAASRETHLAHDAAELRGFIAQLPASPGEPAMVVEEYMAGASSPPSPMFADYVSVESVVVGGRIAHLAVTGRLQQAKPFRETGLVIPSDFAPSLQAEILELASAAIVAVGTRVGCLHTEIKITDDGPRLIEVNGRIGGFVAEVLALAAPGVNLIEISLRAALGQAMDASDLIATEGVGYVIVRQPPQTARRVVSVEGLDVVAEQDGVDAVSLSRQPGDAVDWRLGSHEYVFSVLGAAPDYESVRALEARIDDKVIVTYE